MKTNKLKILVSFILLIIVGLLILFKMYNKPHINVNKASADMIVSADNILNDYLTDEIKANEKYVDKIIQVNGVIANISFENGNSIVTLKDTEHQSGIICHMLPEENLFVLKLKRGSKINVKGVCTGYLLDVIMVRCVLVNT